LTVVTVLQITTYYVSRFIEYIHVICHFRFTCDSNASFVISCREGWQHQ